MFKKMLIFVFFLIHFFSADARESIADARESIAGAKESIVGAKGSIAGATASIMDLIQAIEVNKGEREIQYTISNNGPQTLHFSVTAINTAFDENGNLTEMMVDATDDDGNVIKDEKGNVKKEARETGSFQIVPEEVTVEGNSTSLVTVVFTGEPPKKEKVYMIAFKQVRLVDASNGEDTSTSVGLEMEQEINALVYVRNSDMKPKISEVKVVDNKVFVTNSGTKAMRVGDVTNTVTINGQQKRVCDIVANGEQAVFAGITRAFNIRPEEVPHQPGRAKQTRRSGSKRESMTERNR